jgi:hypothetical protein
MSRGRWTARVGAVLAVMLVAVAVGACGSSSGATEEHAAAKPHSRLVRWSLGSVPHGRLLKIEVIDGYCGAGKRPLISKVHVREEGARSCSAPSSPKSSAPGRAPASEWA